MRRQSTDAVFSDFDVILYVESERDERFRVVEVTNQIDKFLDRSENATDLKIENFVVDFCEICEVDEFDVEIVIEMLLLFLSLLKRDFIALTIFSFVWCCDEKEADDFAILRNLSFARFAISRHANLSSYENFEVEENSALTIVRENTKIEKFMTSELKKISEQKRRERVDLTCKRVYFKICLLKTKEL